MTLEERVSYDTSREALLRRRGNFDEYGELNGEGELIYYYKNAEDKKEERKGTFREDELTEGVVILYYLNGNKEEEHKGTFNRHGVLKKGEVTYYDIFGNVTAKEKRPYFL